MWGFSAGTRTFFVTILPLYCIFPAFFDLDVEIVPTNAKTCSLDIPHVSLRKTAIPLSIEWASSNFALRSKYVLWISGRSQARVDAKFKM